MTKSKNKRRARRPVAKVIPFSRVIDEVDPDDFLTEAQLANILGRSPSTLQKDRCYGRGVPFVKFGGMVRYRFGDLLDYIAAHRVG
jgi:hypothetical protein